LITPFGPGNTYLVADTFGPASQCLLGLMLEAGVKPVVCHVNYHLNEDSDKAQALLAEYCKKEGLVFEVLRCLESRSDGQRHRLSGLAKKNRYGFFTEMYKKHNAAAIFIAHMQDDVLEGYLTAKSQGIKKAKYGYSKVSTYQGMIVVRPLLEFTRSDLKALLHPEFGSFLEAGAG
jgi:tRNA(Ile)-lysidine synthase